MLKQGRRPVASLCIALLALNVVDCYHITQREPRTVIPVGDTAVGADRIRGVTLNDGRKIRFDKKPAVVVLVDTLRANVHGQPTAIAVSDVSRVWLNTVNVATTMLAVVLTVLGALALAVAYYASTLEN